MGNIILTIVYISLAVLTAYIICKSIFNQKHARLTPYLLFFSFTIFVWQILKIFFYTINIPAAVLYLYELDLPLTTLCSLSGLLFIMHFYSKELYISKTIFGALSVIPVCTFVLALITPEYNFFRTRIEIVSMTPYRLIESVPGVWVWMTIVYNFIIISVCIGISMVQHRTLSKGYRLPSTLLIAGLWIILASVTADTYFSGIDISICALAICNAFVFYATRNNQGKEFLVMARNEIFKNMEEAIFITDDEGLIINKNNAVNKILKISGLNLDTNHYQDVFEAIRKKSNQLEVMPDADEGMYVHFFEEPDETVFHIKEKEILDKDNIKIGSFIIYQDVTENKALMGRVDQEGGVDPLTGLSNRRKNKYFISELDKGQNYPLGIIVGDLDNLKAINDSHGHQMGDLMMRVAAEALNFCCPSNCRISRVGGDEFIILMPNAGVPQLVALIKAIQEHLATITAYPFVLSMALGFSIKDRADQKLSDIADMAYDQMLHNKTNQRIKGELQMSSD